METLAGNIGHGGHQMGQSKSQLYSVGINGDNEGELWFLNAWMFNTFFNER